MVFERQRSQDDVAQPMYHEYLENDKKNDPHVEVRSNVHDTFSSETAYTRTRMPTPTDTDSLPTGKPSFSGIFKTTSWLFFTIVVATALFAVTAWFAQSAFTPAAAVSASNALAHMFKVDTGDALAILRVMQGITSTCTTMGMTVAFELTQWALAGRPEGIPFMRFLGIAPTTTFVGILAIVMSRVTDLVDRLWSILRIVLVTAVWVAAVVLFINAHVDTTYSTGFIYDVTAGVGKFNGPYVGQYLGNLANMARDGGYPNTIVPYTIVTTSSNIVSDAMRVTTVDPVNCAGCNSYLLTGGFLMTTPWAPTGYQDYPLVNIDNVPGTQVQYKAGNGTVEFASQDCTVYGEPPFLFGIKVCVKTSDANKGSFEAGIYVCTNGTDSGECEKPASRPNITTTMTIYQRSANLVTARSNFSIMSVTDLTPPTQNSDIDLSAYRDALSWFLDFNASATPATSSVAEYFMNGAANLENTYWSSELTRTFQSILAFPLWYFQPNNYGNVDLNVTTMSDKLPKEFYTKARLTKQFTRIMIKHDMFIVYCVLQGAALVFLWAVLIWLWLTRPKLPIISSYPLVDFAFKAKVADYEGGTGQKGVEGANDKAIRRRLKDSRVALGATKEGFV
ncbi:hypothetical protein K491DRAFT_622242 [Lophiostoma macrostomum CBS 122681]|uniref:Uncharacterized protein n=1 Tax=Lophiostoma macrostomum CBS 122681 TaxID=1314788 RepID=A0A6A6TLJ2_9PLEO|nr:hypothetical protein K491DRAFT_622242 [Lophiostoma macrostomum CBS 122681]